MPADPARRAVELAATSRHRLDESAALHAAVAELLFVAEDAIARSRALLSELDRVSARRGVRGEGAAPEPEDDEAAHR